MRVAGRKRLTASLAAIFAMENSVALDGFCLTVTDTFEGK